MIRLLWIAGKGYRLRPWRSPYLRWRIETYQGWHAEKIGARDFWRFAWANRRELLRYLRWADRMRRDAPAFNLRNYRSGTGGSIMNGSGGSSE